MIKHSIRDPFPGERFAMVGHAFFRLDQSHDLFMSAVKDLSKGVLMGMMKCSGTRSPAPHHSRRKALSQDTDFEYVLVDATICKTHADATSQKEGLEAAGIGRSKGGLTTKIHAVVDAPGFPIRTVITPGQ